MASPRAILTPVQCGFIDKIERKSVRIQRIIREWPEKVSIQKPEPPLTEEKKRFKLPW